MSLYAVCVWLHVVAACAWVGSMIFFSAVVVPVIRRDEVRAAGPGFLLLVGKRYRMLGWVSLGVLVVTGAANLYYRGIDWSMLGSSAFWLKTAFGRALAWKLGFVGLVLAMTAAHDATAKRGRRAASWLGRSLLAASLLIVFFATALVRGFL